MMCKRWSGLWHCNKWKGDVSGTYTKSVPPNTRLEKRLIYQVLKLFGTHKTNISQSSFSKEYVLFVERSISISIGNTVLENSMHKTPESTANTMFNEDNAASGIDPAEELTVEEILEAEPINELADTGKDAICPCASEKFPKKKMHELMWKDPWAEGRKKLLEKDVLFVRAEVAHR